MERPCPATSRERTIKKHWRVILTKTLMIPWRKKGSCEYRAAMRDWSNRSAQVHADCDVGSLCFVFSQLRTLADSFFRSENEFDFREEEPLSFNFTFTELYEALRKDPEVERCIHNSLPSCFHDFASHYCFSESSRTLLGFCFLPRVSLLCSSVAAVEWYYSGFWLLF